MSVINRLVISMFPFLLFISLSPATKAQFPFFLQRFRPVKQSLLSSGSSSYPSFASSLFPLTSSSSLLPTYGSPSSFLSSSSLGSSPFANSISSPFSTSGSSLSSAGLGSLSLSAPFTSSASSLLPHFGASSFTTSNLPSALISSPNFASSNFASPQLNLPQKFSASNLAQSFVDLGSIGAFDGLGSYDHAELLDDYPGFSAAGFGKDLNFAGSQPVKVQSPPPYGAELVYLQRSAEKE